MSKPDAGRRQRAIPYCNRRTAREKAAGGPAFFAKPPAALAVLRRLLDHGEDVVLGHDEIFFAIDGHFVAGVGGEQDAIAFLDLEGGTLAVVQPFAFAEAQHLALFRFLARRIRQNDAAGRLLFRFETLDHDLVIERDDCHAAVLLDGETSIAVQPTASYCLS